jgi:predicted metal-binding protein
MVKSLVSEPAPFDEMVLVCAKCAAKAGRDGGGGTKLRGEIKQALKARGLKGSVRVVETSCLNLCPKGGQTVATLADLRQGRLCVAPANASGAAIIDALFKTRPLLETSRDGLKGSLAPGAAESAPAG